MDERRLRSVRKLAIKSLRSNGIPVRNQWFGRGPDNEIQSTKGVTYNLHNVNLLCADRLPSEWPGIVETHFNNLLAPDIQDLDLDVLPDDELLPMVRTRLRTYDQSAASFRKYVRTSFGDLVVELNLDLPTVVQTLNDSDINDRDIDELFLAGQRNTDAEPFEVGTFDADGATVWLVGGDSLFIASKALNIPHLIDTVLEQAPRGVVFGVPHRHLLYLHPVSDLSSVLAVNAIAQLTADSAQDAPGGAISCDTFYWHPGGVQTITRVEHGKIAVLAEGPFLDAINAASGP